MRRIRPDKKVSERDTCQFCIGARAAKPVNARAADMAHEMLSLIA
jgi:hypothetical protein